MRILEKIRYFINNYGVFIISLAVCISIYLFVNPYVLGVMKSKNIDKFFQATITCTSILLGFSGTLITHILNAKREFDKCNLNNNTKENKLNWFFKTIQPRTMTNTLLVSIVSGVILIMISLFMLITDVITSQVQILFFYLWIYVFIIFICYEVGLYRLFISLLFDNTEKQSPMLSSEDPVAKQDCINAINNQNHS